MKYLKIAFIVGLSIFVSCTTNNSEKAKKVPSKSVKVEPATDKTLQPTENQQATKTIVFFGNSLTAAYQLDPAQGFAGLTQKRINEMGLNYKVVNAGLSGETSAGGLERVEWVLEQPVDIFILELGANDGLRGLNLDKTYENLQGILDKVKDKYPDVQLVIAGMLAPPNMGDEFTKKFAKIFPRLAKENDAALIPFLLDGVGGVPELNLADGIHPNVEGHKVVEKNVWATLEDVIADQEI